MRAREPEAFWRENVIAVFILQFSLNNRTTGNSYQILEVLSLGLFHFLGGGEGRLLDRECLFEEIGYLVKPSTKKLKRIKLISIVSQSITMP